MKHILIACTLLLSFSICSAQYTKENLTGILTNGSTKSWVDKKTNDTYTFNNNLSVQIKKGGAAATNESWALSTPDNVRWIINIGKQPYEIVVSYDKSKTQYVKLVHHGAEKNSPVFHETLLYPAK